MFDVFECSSSYQFISVIYTTVNNKFLIQKAESNAAFQFQPNCYLL